MRQNRQKHRPANDLRLVRERADRELKKIDYNAFNDYTPGARLAAVVDKASENDKFTARRIMSPAYDRSRTQERILKILALSEEGCALADCKDAADIAACGNAYFMRCLTQDIQPMLSGLVNWFDITETEFWREVNRGGERGKQLERLILMIRAYADDAALSGEHPAAVAQWHDKSRYGLTEEKRLTISINSDEDRRKRLANIAKGLEMYVPGPLFDPKNIIDVEVNEDASEE
jgi:hypothetical protein